MEAMVDFTGGCTEMYNLKDDDCPKDLMNIMLKAYQRHSMMGCSMEPDPHETEAQTEVGLIPLIRVRNPWGNEAEWNGAWSDRSAEWQFIPDEEKESLGLTFEADGEFYMSYKDFMQYWDQLEICNLSPDSLDEDVGGFKWEVTSFNS